MGNLETNDHMIVKVCLPDDTKIMPIVIKKEEKCREKLME
jgi:hypothetical protein